MTVKLSVYLCIKIERLTLKYTPVDFQTLHIFTESCRKCPRIVNPVGLLETEGVGKTVLRKGGSCLLLHTMQHTSRLESAARPGEKLMSITDIQIDGSTQSKIIRETRC